VIALIISARIGNAGVNIGNILTRIVLFSMVLMAGTNVFAERPYADKTDAELTALASSWETMNSVSRRALLTEMKGRMRASGKPALVRIHARRRYGRLVRQPDGRVVRIETEQHVVRYRPLSPEEIASKTVEVTGLPATQVTGDKPVLQKAAQEPALKTGKQGFGVGFEQRVSHSSTKDKSK
jgi:hypothetical protein